MLQSPWDTPLKRANANRRTNSMEHSKYGLTAQEFYPAFVETVKLALARYNEPAELPRLRRGIDLAEREAVQFHADSTAIVTGDAGMIYHVNGECPCPDYERAPGQRCKHRWAVAIARKTLQLAAESRDLVWHECHSVDRRDAMAAQEALASMVCTPEWRMRHGGQHEQTAGK